MFVKTIQPGMQEMPETDQFFKWIDLKRMTDTALDDSIVAGLTQLVIRENVDVFEELHRFQKLTVESTFFFNQIQIVHQMDNCARGVKQD